MRLAAYTIGGCQKKEFHRRDFLFPFTHAPQPLIARDYSACIRGYA